MVRKTGMIIRVINGLWLLVLAGLLVVAGACRTKDVRQKIIRIPQVHTQSAADIVTKALVETEGVSSVSVSIKEGTVSVTYDSMRVALKNLEAAISDAGFDANDTPADTRARAALPASCL